MRLAGLPPKQGLYDPRFEHDACGVGFVVHIKGERSHEIVDQALTILQNLDHRGAFSRSIGSLQLFRDDPIKVATRFLKPLGGSPVIGSRRRKAQIFNGPEVRTRKLFKKWPALAQRSLQVHLSLCREQIEDDVGCRMGFGKFLNATCRRMQTQLQFIK